MSGTDFTPLSRSPTLGHREVSGCAAARPAPPCTPARTPQPPALALPPASSLAPGETLGPAALWGLQAGPRRWLSPPGGGCTGMGLGWLCRGDCCSFQASSEYLQTQWLWGGPRGAPRASAAGCSLRRNHGPRRRASGRADTTAGDPELGDGAHNRVMLSTEQVGAGSPGGVPLCWGPMQRGDTSPPDSQAPCPWLRAWGTPGRQWASWPGCPRSSVPWGISCHPWTKPQHAPSTAPPYRPPEPHGTHRRYSRSWGAGGRGAGVPQLPLGPLWAQGGERAGDQGAQSPPGGQRMGYAEP